MQAGGLLLAGLDPTGMGGVIAGFGDQREVELLVEAGFTPLEAIHIATANGAQYLGELDRIGTIAAGKQADLVVIKGDPSKKIEDIENVETVFKDGIGYDSAKLIESVRGVVGSDECSGQWSVFSGQYKIVSESDRMIVLASASPRRQELLRNAGIPFTVQPADIDETPLAGESPRDCAERLAREKALAVVSRRPRDYVLGADTIVVVDDAILGKPRDADDAARMLRMLSGRTHAVITGVCVVASGQVGQSVES